MDLPFTVDQFLGVFAQYNQSVWPLQLAFYGFAVLAIVLAVRPSGKSSRRISVLLSLLWGWMAVVYHWGYFAEINPAAIMFGGLFLLEAVALLLEGVFRDRLSFRFEADLYGIGGAIFIAYSLIVYPLLGVAAGHGFPRGATFGLPCPTTIFTFGLLLWTDSRVPLTVLVIPAAWSFLGFSAAVQLTIVEDYGLLIAGVSATVLLLLRNHKLGRSHATPTAAT
jgi:hypothetical protein